MKIRKKKEAGSFEFRPSWPWYVEYSILIREAAKDAHASWG